MWYQNKWKWECNNLFLGSWIMKGDQIAGAGGWRNRKYESAVAPSVHAVLAPLAGCFCCSPLNIWLYCWGCRLQPWFGEESASFVVEAFLLFPFLSSYLAPISDSKLCPLTKTQEQFMQTACLLKRVDWTTANINVAYALFLLKPYGN